MKKKVWMWIVAAVLLLAVLFTPIPSGVYKDGGTREYTALTYKIVDWNRLTADSTYNETKLYFFPYNFKSIDSLWALEEDKVEHKFRATVAELNDMVVIVEPVDGDPAQLKCPRISNVLGNHISWMSNAGNCTAETVMVDRNGTQAAALKLVSVDGNFNNLAISTKQALTPGEYTLSYWMKVDAGIDAQPGMMFNDIACYEQFPDGTPYNCYISGDGVWRQFSYTFTLDDSAASYATTMYFRFFHTAGTVYLSDLSLICNTPENPVSEWNVSLGDNIGVNFVMNVTETDVVSFTVAGNAAEAVKSGNTYTISLAAAQMTDEIVISVNGEALEKTYSVRQYADYILDDANGFDEKTQTLVLNMLNYGAASQTYFGYNADSDDKLANNGYAIEAATVPTSGGELVVTDNLSGLSFYGASLVHQNKIAVRFYFTGSVEGIDFGDYTYEEKDGMYYIEVAGINPQDLEQDITVEISDGTDTLSVSYAPMDYIIRMYNKANSTENAKALIQALYGYYLAAEAYAAQ